MSNTSPPVCPFEHIANPDQEAVQIAETADLTVKQLDRRYPPPKQVLRGVHPKSHGCVSATFTIDPGIPPELRVGLFATPGKQFRAIIRFSNAENLVRPDINQGQHGSRGMAIKVLDVDGDILDEDGGAHNQDFLMINQPAFVFANTEDYLRLSRVLDRNNDDGSGFFAPTQADGISAEAAGRIPRSGELLKQVLTTPVANPLGTQYFSAAPFLFGPDRVMKFSAKHCQVVQPSEVPKEPAANYLGDHLTQAMLGQGSLRFDFMVQVRGGGADLGVENACSVWEEKDWPFVKVAEITIPTPQPDVGTAAHQAHCESLVFTPWHSLAAHQPIGSINRLRRSVYQVSAERRGTGILNGDYTMSDLARSSQRFRLELLDDGNYSIVPLHSSKPINVKDGSLENGAYLTQWEWKGGDNQRFAIEKMPDGFVRFINKQSGKAIHVHGGSLLSGGEITQWEKVAADNLLFRFVTLPDGSTRIIGKASNKVLAVQGGSLDSGARLIQTDPLD